MESGFVARGTQSAGTARGSRIPASSYASEAPAVITTAMLAAVAAADAAADALAHSLQRVAAPYPEQRFGEGLFDDVAVDMAGFERVIVVIVVTA